jgi:glutamate synthase domain-containing protein 3
MVDLEPLDGREDAAHLRELVDRHLRYTNSPRAAALLDDWDRAAALFVKVVPVEYRRALERSAGAEEPAPHTEGEVAQLALRSTQ